MANSTAAAIAQDERRAQSIAAATAAFVAAQRDDKRRGAVCKAFSEACAAYVADGLTAEDASHAIAEDVTITTDGRVTAPKPATVKAHVAAWAAVAEHYTGRDAERVAGAAYVARTSKRAGGAKAVATILASSKVAADVVAALDAMPKADAKDAEATARALRAADVVAYLERVAAQQWETADAEAILAALHAAGTALIAARA